MTEDTPTISILIVNYSSRVALTRCLSDLAQIRTDAVVEILIANNDQEPLHIDVPHVRVIQQGKNVGFGRAHNSLSQEASGSILCFLNPDTYNFTPSFLELPQVLSDDIGIVAPLLVNPDNSPQAWSVGTNLTPLQLIFNNIGAAKKIWNAQKARDVDWVSGGAFFIAKKDFIYLGGFDEGYFLYFEDLDLCRRMRASGKKVFWNPAVHVTHDKGGSSESVAAQKSFYYTSQDFYFTKFYGTRTAQILAAARTLFHY